jgi:ATP-dependent Clp protease ATP-binding subunit ClpA
MTTKNNTPVFTVVDHNELSAAEISFAEQFGGRVIGQPAALKVASLAYNLARNPLRDRTRPIGIFYLAGPSRTGKSLTGVALAEIFHDDPEALTRIQASDYTEDHQILDLKGAPPTYVGFKDPKDPKNKLEPHEVDAYSVVSPHNMQRVRLHSREEIDIVVIEEFEKSTLDFYKFWMGVFDKGVAKLGNGQIADFRNTIFIITSNIGMDELEKMQEKGIGFITRETKATKQDVETVVNEQMKRRYKPEFRNRLDAVVIFQPFNSESLTAIVDSEIAQVQKRINEQMKAGDDFVLEVTAEAKQHLLKTVDFNVAELKRVINRDVLMPLGRLLNTDKVVGGDIVRVDVNADDSALSFSVASDGYGVAAHEEQIAKMGKRAGSVNLTTQREIRKAALAARGGGSQEWSVIMTASSMKEMSARSVELLHTLENVIEVEVPHVTFQRKAPFIFSVIVKASREQMTLLARLHAEDELAINPVAQKLLPAK